MSSFRSSFCSALSVTVLTLGTCLAFAELALADAHQPVKVAIQVGDGKHRAYIKELFQEFERQHPDIDYELIVLRDVARYPSIVSNWLTQGYGPDIIYWYAGQRIEHFKKLGLLQDIDTFWQSQNLDKHFPTAVADTVKVDGKAWGIPITYFLWALYYRESVMEKHGIEVPKNWAQLLSACRVLREKNIDLFAFGSKTSWATHAWFDYINLRLHGLQFHRELLAGRVAYDDARVKATLGYWRQLLDSQCFNENHASYTVWQAFPRVLHGLSAMTLSDGVPQIDIPNQIRADVRLAQFPLIVEDMPLYTVAPVNAFVLPSYTKASPELNLMLRFLADPEFQLKFNQPIARPPAAISKLSQQDILAQEAEAIVLNSPGGIQFLDRDADIRFADKTPQIFVEFLQHRDVNRAALELERLRMRVFGPLPR
ncbi:ABC transporter substrate-binding protein [Agaribacterium haliotis]|uniref:ABC transporter substrate-binding protein n=1 Tax=Agaribacterium haliotis TaxID=2013869 RepID=UPI001304158C|nr:extracellular solute-binding protein [Agaribacterium haliotis]